MNKPVALDLVCPDCLSVMQPSDTRCTGCGAEVDASRTSTRSCVDSARENDRDSFLDNRWFVLGLLFLALAGFGLPLLWKSSAFSPLGKVVLTIVVLLYTLLLLWLIAIGVQQIFALIQEFREALR